MNLENIKLFFQPSYLLNPYPSYSMTYLVSLLVFFIALLIISFVFLIISKRKRKNKPLAGLLSQFTGSFFWFGILGLILLFFRYEGIPFMSARVLLFLAILCFILWTIYLLIFKIKKYKKEIKEMNEKIEREKYFKRK